MNAVGEGRVAAIIINIMAATNMCTATTPGIGILAKTLLKVITGHRLKRG